MLMSSRRVAADAGTGLSHQLGWLGLGGLLTATLVLSSTTLFPGTAVLLPALSTALILWATTRNPHSLIARTLGARPLQVIGRLSYSWYLWHWPVIVLGSAIILAPSLTVRMSLAALSLVPAAASFWLVEDPIRHSRWLTSRNPYSLAMAGALAALLVVVSTAWTVGSGWASRQPSQARYTAAPNDGPLRLSRREGCIAGYSALLANPCDFGDEHAPDTVVLIGDSHAAQWFSALDLIASQKHWRLVTLLKVSCAPVEVVYFDTRLGRYYPECDEWRHNAIEAIRRIRPALTIVTSIRTYTLSDGEWENGLAKIVDSLATVSGGVLLLKDTPSTEVNMASCLAQRAWRASFVPSPSCGFSADDPTDSKVYDFQRRTAARHTNVRAADVSSALCSGGVCQGEIGNILVYRDSNHLTASAVISLKPILEAEVDKTIAAGRHGG